MTEARDLTGYVDITEDRDGGLLKKILSEGEEGTYPQPGDQVHAHYTGTLDDGTEFDSSRKRGKPFQFIIGQRQVIRGWDLGFAVSWSSFSQPTIYLYDMKTKSCVLS